eukprot:TRINITY_DN2291_c0_g1_i4.p1 TRINITY_DN2291_c0_g1~~TRINITY_DN2291_c0_g1_i4.p1  ORF type:complete len:107 (-),score=4.22 TRINITY_DN2291_c0_g1_i4:201-491(-)
MVITSVATFFGPLSPTFTPALTRIRTIQQFQLVGPAFRPVPGYQKFLADSPLTSLDMERAFERSVELEPNKPSQNRAACVYTACLGCTTFFIAAVP